MKPIQGGRRVGAIPTQLNIWVSFSFSGPIRSQFN